MNFLPVPKIMKWDWNLSQRYSSDRKILITSGGSFTSSSLTLECASSWPGYMRDRCRFDWAEDWSYPGVGNFYISQSIIEAIENRSESERNKCFVAVMWTGLTNDETVQLTDKQPKLMSGSYQPSSVKLQPTQQTLQSYNYIKKTQSVLEKYNIPFAFTFFMNMLVPPFLPVRDDTHFFIDHLDSKQLKSLEEINVLAGPKDCLYDFSFYKNYIEISPDHYHPTGECVLDWTDSVWLPALVKRGLICNT